MNTIEFMDKFKELAPRKKWYVIFDSFIRSEDNECPICFVDNQLNHSGKLKRLETFSSTEISHNMTPQTLIVIATAADMKVDEHPDDAIKSCRRLLEMYASPVSLSS